MARNPGKKVRHLFVGIAGVCAAGVLTLTMWWWRAVPEAASVHIDATPQRLARGKQIFDLAHCDMCHSGRDFSRFNGPVIAGAKGAGVVFPRRLVPTGRITGPNITPHGTGLAQWTDGEKVRAIREGYDREGRKLTPAMPYEQYRRLSDEDVYSLVAYLGSLQPVQNAVPASEFDLETWASFRLAMLRDVFREPTRSVPEPERSDRIAYGQYLVDIGQCKGCHGPDLAGGVEFHEAPFATVFSANISPDIATGIGGWSEAAFVARFHAYRQYTQELPPVVSPYYQTPMPWLSLARLDEAELQAIYAYLRSQPPLHNKVQPFGAANARLALVNESKLPVDTLKQ